MKLFQSVPGLGPELAKRIHEHLDVDTLEALEVAAHDGRLETVPGVGRRRATAVRIHLSSALKRTRDWVVVYYYDDEHHEGQHTVVTETRGPLTGRRVVRGREAECQAYYRTAETVSV